jgi:hypothetical protein
MHMKTQNRLFEPISKAGRDTKVNAGQHPRRTMGSLLLIGVLVLFGAMIWKDLYRTLRIHMM